MKKEDILSSIKERLSSPLFFSFVISWLVINWKITIALFWNDPEHKSLGHLSLISFIESQTSYWSTIILPFILALAYTFGNPLVKNVISAFRTWTSKWGEAWNLSILKGSKVPIEKYLGFKEHYDKRTKVLEEIITNQDVTQQKFEEANTALLYERNEKNKITTELMELKSIVGSLTNVSVIDGRWNKKISDAIAKEKEEKWQITNGAVYLIEGKDMIQVFSVQDFIYDVNAKKVSFVLWKIKDSQFYSFNSLSFEHGDLDGFEYRLSNRRSVTYYRPPKTLSGENT
jgi:hypothetical protein